MPGVRDTNRNKSTLHERVGMEGRWNSHGFLFHVSTVASGLLQPLTGLPKILRACAKLGACAGLGACAKLGPEPCRSLEVLVESLQGDGGLSGGARQAVIRTVCRKLHEKWAACMCWPLETLEDLIN